jgi:type IV pilus assembly protein PilX
VKRARGISLVVVLVLLVATMVLGIAGARISTQSEQSARAARDYNLAFQSAEAALRDAEQEIVAGSRAAILDVVFYPPGCVAAIPQHTGLCATPIDPTQPSVWETDWIARAAKYGQFTGGRCLPTSDPADGFDPARCSYARLGVARQPRYVIERLATPGPLSAAVRPGRPRSPYLYRITAVGYGARDSTQVVLQTLYYPD